MFSGFINVEICMSDLWREFRKMEKKAMKKRHEMEAEKKPSQTVT